VQRTGGNRSVRPMAKPQVAYPPGQNRKAKAEPLRLPPGLKHNLVWYTFRKFQPMDPIGLFQYLAGEFGDIAHYKLGHMHIVFLNRPDYIREVLVVQNDNFAKERTVQRMKMLLGEGMINSEGEQHRDQRRAAQPAFHRQQVSGYGRQMVAEAESLSESWQDGEEIDLAQEMMRLTLDIVAKTLFSTELGGEVQELTTAINEIMGMYNFLVALPAVDLLVHLGIPGVAGFAPAKRRVDAVVYRMIETHRRQKNSRDLLDMMIASEENSTSTSDESLRDQVITIFLAGYETVANVLIWSWYLISQHPLVEEMLQDELTRVLAGRAPVMEDVPNLRYLESVIAESMRLYPPAWAMGRRARQDFSLGDYRLPRGTTVLISQFVTHRDPRFFKDPLRFMPERFAAGGRNSFPKFSYFPFGAGGRQCIGEAYAWTESILVMATIAQRWRLTLVPGQKIEPQALITLRAKHGIRARLEARSAQFAKRS
jgi:cytochrome P450